LLYAAARRPDTSGRWLRPIFTLLAASFDHLVRAGEQRRGYFYPERLGGLEVDNRPEFRGLLDRDVAGFRALENLVDEHGGAAKLLKKVPP
jgi:hypothetical protein